MDTRISLEMFSHAVSLIGAVMVLVAYLLLSRGTFSAKSPAFQMMNLLGVIGIGFEVFLAGAWASFLLNVAWGIIALLALVQIWRAKRDISRQN